MIVVVLGANAPVVNAAQSKKVPRVALFWFEPVPQSRIDEFRRALRDLGYIEARNIVLEHREAGGKRERLPELAAELVGLKPDIIVASSGVVIEALRNTATKIPIVMPTISDPTGGGFVANPMRPEGNITGLTNFAPELSGKRLELLKEAVPTITRVAVLWRSSPVQESGMKELEFSARSLKVRLQPVSARGPKGLDEAFQTVAKARPHALLTLPDPLFLGQRTRIAEFALRSRLPTMAGARELAEAGGLMAYGPDFSYNFRRAAVYVDKILKGAKPQDLPVENPMKFELIINLKTAKEIGVNVPPRVLMWADKVIK
ncbi:MAG: ABC transporter substrate-binding protein [Candidatus Omnitrophica bacterium]|nr:ABC transporter substrate-binding protein [Candidatus Omnitrophota bacterium]